MIEVFYEWTKRHGLKRIEIMGPEDKRPEIPQVGKFGRAHQRSLDIKKRKPWKR